MKKIVFTFFCVIFFLISSGNHVNAEGEFETQYDVTYNVADNGLTDVKYNIVIINKRADVVATKYSLSLKQTIIDQVKAYDKKGDLELEKNVDGDIVTLTVELRDQVVGLDKKNNFTLDLKTSSIASKVGEIWNINIPQVQNIGATGKYDVTLSVPAVLGPKIYITPQIEENIQSNRRIYKFTKKDLENSGISASYGKYQVLNYNLKYQLVNDSPFSVIREIALPPDISKRQKVFYTSLTPPPLKVTRDKDGNIMAQYRVRSKSTLSVSLVGSARLMGEQISPEFGGRIGNLPSNLVSTYTKGQKYWETDSSVIKKIAANLKDDNLNVIENAQKIYNFVVQNLNYDFEIESKGTVERKGALRILSEKDQAACMEFTDLFIAISRAMGIPAREINGYAFSTNDARAPISVNLKGGDVLHAWPEYYDPNLGWIAVDPTWGATSKMDYFTKLDTNHFAFVIKGIDPEYPLPAGAYKSNEQTNTVDISFSDSSNPISSESEEDLQQAQKFVEPNKGIPLLVFIIISLALVTVISVYYILHKNKNPSSA